MTPEDALMYLAGRSAVCTHESYQALGTGEHWGQCEDCGQQFTLSTQDSRRARALKVDHAVEAIRDALHVEGERSCAHGSVRPLKHCSGLGKCEDCGEKLDIGLSTQQTKPPHRVIPFCVKKSSPKCPWPSCGRDLEVCWVDSGDLTPHVCSCGRYLVVQARWGEDGDGEEFIDSWNVYGTAVPLHEEED